MTTPQLYLGDCRSYPQSHALWDGRKFSAIITDPPYALVSIGKRFGKVGAAPARSNGASGVYSRASAGFLGQQWDTGEVAFDPETWAGLADTLHPGGHVAAFGGTRTYHQLACAIEDAGLEIRDCLMWVYGTGFPKSHDVARNIDKMDARAAQRERRLAFTEWMRSTGLTSGQIDALTGTQMGTHYTTAASQPQIAVREHFEAMRPFIPGTVPQWVEDLVDERTAESENLTRREVVGHHDSYILQSWRDPKPPGAITRAHTSEARTWEGWGTALKPAWEPIILARKPMEGRTVADCVLEFGTGALNIDACRTPVVEGRGKHPANVILDGSAEVSGALPPTASRLFYSAKATKADRAGSKHPTVKPVALMRWLVDLIVAPGGRVLDPFAGSGTTGEACRQAGVDCVLIEREPQFAADIRRRFDLEGF